MISETIKNMTNCNSSKDVIISDDNMSTISKISIIRENLCIDHNLDELNVIQKKMTRVNKKNSKLIDDNIDDVIEI